MRLRIWSSQKEEMAAAAVLLRKKDNQELEGMGGMGCHNLLCSSHMQNLSCHLQKHPQKPSNQNLTVITRLLL
ncbi:hypothetical protein O6P43_021308 [Quillaja saponaria]|uniref:Uncharacterized protein n=1 Tax=Quillaja saponaria TaxID=32244 RepID=A0AAD7LML6_QUISA|nr:hypothetical protein O6P43_021308 [Quillaja saponaria]